MAKRIGMEVSLAVSEAVKLANADVIAAYPITPQTHIVEHLSELVADGQLDAAYIPVESEHSAMSSSIGASAAGARTFTATSSQGLALMNEMIYIAPVLRTPVVMAIANRALSAPINIWNDHSDIMSVRDAGWVSLFAENGQESLDLTLIAFRVAEDRKVSLPTNVNLDGFTLSHFIEPILIPEQADVDKFLPPFKPSLQLDIKKPISIGLLGAPESYTESRKATDDALEGSKAVIVKAFEEFEAVFGRKYGVVESYKADDAETVIVAMGSIAETCMTAVDELREAGKKVGVVRIRLWRPFPADELLKAIGGAKNVAVLDRHMILGCPSGPVGLEVKSLLYNSPIKPNASNWILGLGGRDVTRNDFKYIFERAASTEAQRRAEIVGVFE
jgi:pyruvate ferredoxin oxidoreductase alpha subunit